ncbi:MAG: threonine synthase [Flavisolibacter sp.]|nr:threonine synthase [Flavisolibacter sp.]
MLFYSLNTPSHKVNFKEATIRGQAPDKGLYFPESIPVLPDNFIKNIEQYTKEEIAFTVINPYVGDTIPDAELKQIIEETINFPFPLVPINDRIFCLELFHGPTLAFKDVGARFMSRCLGYFVASSAKKVTVLVATSGDTGGAVADGFYGVEGVDVVILYPSGKVSAIQELQLTTLSKNITALEVAGTFDDCQRLVKQAFADEELKQTLFLTSANSINVARWLPQQFYYFYAYQQWQDKNQPPVVCVPSGNFGNICAGLLAHQSALPVQKFIAACNANDVVPVYLKNGAYQPKEAVATLSNAMDVGNPSNFIRILELFNQQFESVKEKLYSYCISDEETKTTIKAVHQNHHYILDPHGAVGFAALQQYLQQHPEQKGYLLETAHPVKFLEAVEGILNEKIQLPESIEGLLKKKKTSIAVEPDYEELKGFLMDVSQYS